MRKWCLVTWPVSQWSPQLWPSEHVIVAWSVDAQTWDMLSFWPLICSDCFPRPRKKWKLLFTIYNRAKTTTEKPEAEKKIMSHHAREYRIKIQVLWFRSISWRRWLFPCIINRRYWIDISQPARWDSIQLFMIHSLTQLHTVACFILRRGSHRDRSCQF